jgi:microsomal epoxide hydrolase
MAWDKLPTAASLEAKPFTAQVSDAALNDFDQLLELSKIGPKTYENTRTNESYGVSRSWLEDAKLHWQTRHDW